MSDPKIGELIRLKYYKLVECDPKDQYAIAVAAWSIQIHLTPIYGPGKIIENHVVSGHTLIASSSIPLHDTLANAVRHIKHGNVSSVTF